MTDPDQTKQTRRARRRAERERAPEEREAESEESVEEEAEQAEASADDQESVERGDDAAAVEPGPSRAERRAAKKKKKTGQAASTAEIRDRNRRVREDAAARRREKRERGRAAAATGLDASEMVDDALARASHRATQWIRKHFTIIQWVIVLAVAGGIGWQIWSWRHGKSVAKASDVLITGVEAEHGRIGAPEDQGKADPITGVVDPRPIFATDEARLQAATQAYQEAAELRKGSGTAILAKLGLAGVYYDQGKYDEAIQTYEAVKGSELAKHDADVRLRAVEGIGLAREAKKELDAALKAFKELENSDVPGFKSLGLFHQARVLYTKGEKDKAKELVKATQEQLTKDRSPYQNAGYLDTAARELMAAIDPSTAPAAPAYSPEQLEALQEQILQDPTKLQKMLEEMGKSVPKVPDLPALPLQPSPAPGAPEAPEAPAPPGSAAP